MSWTNCFPVLTDEMVDVYEAEVADAERAELDKWFGVVRKLNERPEAKHVVAVSLFWKQVNAADGELPHLTREIFINARELGLVKRYEPWPHYVQPILDGAEIIRNERPDLVIRVYLAADLEFLEPDLVQAGCEVWLMRHSSIHQNPGAMWRFLALEEADRLVTIIDSDAVRDVLAHVQRTELMQEHGLGFWRVPLSVEPNADQDIVYLPILASGMGSSMQVADVAQLMKATVWNSLRGTANDYCKRPGYGRQKLAGASWPNYGYDEYFLRLAIFPRVAFHGVLTLVPLGMRSLFLPMDIEYCTWANPIAELIYFGEDESANQLTAG